MAVIRAWNRNRRSAGQVFGFGRFRGLGDAASDAILSSASGSAAMAAAQAAAAKLPSGFTMGDPTSAQWGASYYGGKKIIGSGPSYTGSGVVWFLEDNSEGPAYSDATMQLIQDAANAAYAVYQPIEAIRTASPAMYAILTDPEWIALEGTGSIDWDSLSAGLQSKIKQVPELYNTLIGNLAALTPYVPPPAPSGPARYLIGGVEFLSDGTVISYNGTPVTGQTLTSAAINSLMTTGQLPAGATTFATAPAPTTTVSYVPGSPDAAATTPAPTSTAPSSTFVPGTLTPTGGDLSTPTHFATVNDTPSGAASFATPAPASSGAALPTDTGASSSGKWWLLGAGVAGIAFIMTQGRPSHRRRR
jgi:hypothetical protein